MGLFILNNFLFTWNLNSNGHIEFRAQENCWLFCSISIPTWTHFYDFRQKNKDDKEPAMSATELWTAIKQYLGQTRSIKTHQSCPVGVIHRSASITSCGLYLFFWKPQASWLLFVNRKSFGSSIEISIDDILETSCKPQKVSAVLLSFRAVISVVFIFCCCESSR